jgi:hypothetical protein
MDLQTVVLSDTGVRCGFLVHPIGVPADARLEIIV